MSDFLVDTNVLVYGHDPRDQDKQGKAIAVLEKLLANKQAVLSVQCLTEFFDACRRKLAEALTAEQALAQVERFSSACRVLDLTPLIAQEACRCSINHRMSLWDALILVTAKLNQVPYLLTEDGEHHRLLEGVRYLNPFHPRFDMAMLEVG